MGSLCPTVANYVSDKRQHIYRTMIPYLLAIRLKLIGIIVRVWQKPLQASELN